MAANSEFKSSDEYGRFLRMSQRVGRDILKTQGAGGNTSIKDGAMMWVKASGTWLSNAEEQDIMVPVKVDGLVTALRDGDPSAEKSTDFVIPELNSSGLRPSIETSFHAALNSLVIAHYHCVNAIALGVLDDREEELRVRMNGLSDLKWTTIPYRRPGTPLAREIEKAAASNPDVLILFNHGIIVCGATVDEVEERIRRVTEALSIPPRRTGEPDLGALTALARGSRYRPAGDVVSHVTALAHANQAIASGGSLYPDHVIFLGTKVGILPDGQSAATYEASHAAEDDAPKMLIVPGKGILLSSTLTPGGEVMARCLAEVVARIPDGRDVHYLSTDEEHELTHWEAEQYRQALDRDVARQSA